MYINHFINKAVIYILQTRLRMWSVNYDKFNMIT